MGALFRSGVALIVLGFILIGAGYYMLAHPGTVKESSVVERQVVVWFGSAQVDPGAYVYKEFTVPSGAEDPRLELTLVYGEPVISERESESAGVTVAMAGWAILGLGMIIAAIARIRGWMSRKRF